MKGTKAELKAFLKEWLEAGTCGCTLQHDGWSCNTCFFDFAERVGIPEPLQEGFWKTILAIRGDYDDFDWNSMV